MEHKFIFKKFDLAQLADGIVFSALRCPFVNNSRQLRVARQTMNGELAMAGC
jgi:hypothetical protein